MLHSKTSWLLGIAAFVMVMAPTVVMAQKSEANVSSGDMVRRKLLYRSTRFEIAPQMGMTIADAYRRNMLAGVAASYHLTNSFSLAGTGNFGVLQFDTDLSDNLTQTLEARNPSALNGISYPYIQWQADVGIHYVPIFGKFTILRSLTLNYDIHMGAGAAIVGEGVDPAIEGGDVDDAVGGTKPGALLQFGARFYISDMVSLNFEMKNLFYSRVDISRGNADSSFRNRVMLAVGLGIFLPGDVKISR